MSILVLTSDTLIGTPATGNIEYNGQFFGTDSNASRAQMQRLVLETAKPSTSGTSIAFSGLPAWVKRVTIMFVGISTNGASNLALQIGPVAGVETSGYAGYAYTPSSTATSSVQWNIAGANSAASLHYGTAVISLADSATNTWVLSAVGAGVGVNVTSSAGGSKALAGTLSTLRIIGSNTGSPVDTFDAGSINILYEG